MTAQGKDFASIFHKTKCKDQCELTSKQTAVSAAFLPSKVQRYKEHVRSITSECLPNGEYLSVGTIWVFVSFCFLDLFYFASDQIYRKKRQRERLSILWLTPKTASTAGADLI